MMVKVHFGIVAGFEQLTADKGFAAVSYQYYFSGYADEGWLIGVNVGIRRIQDPFGFGWINKYETRSQTFIGLDIGYKV